MDILGIDISKNTFDVALLREDEYRLATFDNDSAGFIALRKWLKKRRFNFNVQASEVIKDPNRV